MSSVTHSARLAYEDYLLFPDDGKKHEIMNGEHYVTPSPRTKHQIASGNLSRLLGAFVHKAKLGRVFAAPFDVILSDADVVQPDLLFISAARASIITEKNVQGAPDLTIEILSETTRKTDTTLKRKLYERHGVLEYWIVDPENDSVETYRSTDTGFIHAGMLSREEGGVLSSPLFPGLAIPLTEIFE
ncbi:MAG: Uma2 family endonuclease [Nitrospirae bacterium]|nr:Uma2 family endonuclease [Nitrospirota bacterium]